MRGDRSKEVIEAYGIDEACSIITNLLLTPWAEFSDENRGNANDFLEYHGKERITQ